MTRVNVQIQDQVTEAVVETLFDIPAERIRAPEPPNIVRHEGSNNDVAEVRFGNGRALMVKRALHDWSLPRFRAAEAAAGLLRQRGMEAPDHVTVPADMGELPVTAYWRIPLPTLAETWPTLDDEARVEVLKSWGELAKTAHAVTFGEFGPLPGAGMPHSSLGEFLHEELDDRLRPAVRVIWPEALKILDVLSQAVDSVDSAVAGSSPSLLHQDMHMGNVLVQRENGRIRCVGFIDLESVQAGPPEADLANARVQHDTLFGQDELHPAFGEHLAEGYGRPLDPVPLRFYETYHLVNLGFYSALTGDKEHARLVARAAEESVADDL